MTIGKRDDKVNRLTKWLDDEYIFAGLRTESNKAVGFEADYHRTPQIRQAVQNAINRLAEYEDTGLTPDEVCSLKEVWDMYGGEEGIVKALEVGDGKEN